MPKAKKNVRATQKKDTVKREERNKKSIEKKTTKSRKALTQNVLTYADIERADVKDEHGKRKYVGFDTERGDHFKGRGFVHFDPATKTFEPRFPLDVNGSPLPSVGVFCSQDAYSDTDELQVAVRINPGAPDGERRLYVKVCFQDDERCVWRTTAFRFHMGNERLEDLINISELIYSLAERKPRKMAEFTNAVENGIENSDIGPAFTDDMKQRLVSMWLAQAFRFPLRLRAVLFHADFSNDYTF